MRYILLLFMITGVTAQELAQNESIVDANVNSDVGRGAIIESERAATISMEGIANGERRIFFDIPPNFIAVSRGEAFENVPETTTTLQYRQVTHFVLNDEGTTATSISTLVTRTSRTVAGKTKKELKPGVVFDARTGKFFRPESLQERLDKMQSMIYRQMPAQ